MSLPAPALRPSQRESIAAELMARADELPVPAQRPRRLPTVLAAAGSLAAAAALAFVLMRPSATTDAPPTAAPIGRIAPPAPPIVRRDPAPPPAPNVVESAPRVIALDRDHLTLDTRDAAPAKIVRGDTSVAVREARVKVVAKRGVIAQVHVFAGSAQVTVDGTTILIEQGVTWTRPDPEPAAPAISARDRSLATFRTGWEKLRAGDNAAAIAALDQATDEVVAEDAMYWAAVASERSGRADARTRFERFIAVFPQSPRIDAAKAAVVRLSPAR
jgi:hypothetical protein